MLAIKLLEPKIEAKAVSTAPPFDLPAIRARANEMPAGQARNDMFALIRECKRLQRELDNAGPVNQ